MLIEGQVTVKLQYLHQKVVLACVHSQRPLQAQAVLQHKQPSEAIELIGNLYQICGKAQMYAAVSGFEQCLQLQANDEAKLIRQQLVRMESIREHCWRIFLNWPSIIDAPANKAPLKTLLEIDLKCQQLMRSHAFDLSAQAERPDVNQQRHCLKSLSTLLEDELFGMPPSTWLSLNETEFNKWLEHHSNFAAKVLKEILIQDWAELGHTDTQHLNPEHLVEIDRCLAANDNNEFIQQPELFGQCFESTPFSRQQSHSLMQSVTQHYGSGLFSRLTALLVEIAVLFEEMLCSKADQVPEWSTHHIQYGTSSIAMINAARGSLIHRIELVNEKVAKYQIVAPTEWNFHPQGTLARALTTLTATSESSLLQQASLLIEAMDPCVRYSLEIKQNA